ncbi:MAG: hypothetical protein MUO31_15025 [Thermodesulfovibrionales bacterium]|nr:hypothetical protein [Thermodesulfovibrionales bacterium]
MFKNEMGPVILVMNNVAARTACPATEGKQSLVARGLIATSSRCPSGKARFAVFETP